MDNRPLEALSGGLRTRRTRCATDCHTGCTWKEVCFVPGWDIRHQHRWRELPEKIERKFRLKITSSVIKQTFMSCDRRFGSVFVFADEWKINSTHKKEWLLHQVYLVEDIVKWKLHYRKHKKTGS